jgi:hypothetical protein
MTATLLNSKVVRVAVWICFALAALALGQQAGQQKKEAPPAQKSEPAPLFGGQLGIRSSAKTKESATLGFNGIDPSGRVDKAMMATTPGDKDRETVANLDKNRPSDAEVEEFIRQGGLKK